MPRIVEFEGKKHQFPDDFSDEDISSALSSIAPPPAAEPPKKGILDTAVDTLKDGVGFAASMIKSPVSPVVDAAETLVGGVKDDFKQAEATGGTPLLSGAGAKSMVDAASIGMAEGVNIAAEILSRPDRDIGMLSRERNEEIKALMQQGLDWKTAHAQVRAAAQAERDAELAASDVRMAGNREAAMTARDDTLAPKATELLEHAENIVSSTAITAPSIVVGATTRSVPLALSIAGATTYPYAYDKSRADGSSDERAKVSAGLQSAVEVAGELLPMQKLLGELGKEGLAKLVTDYMIRETGSEVLTTAGQELVSKIVDRPEESMAEFGDKLLKDVVNTAVETPFSAALGGSFAHLIGGRRRPEDAVEEVAKAAQSGDKDALEVAEARLDDVLDEVNAEARLPQGSMNTKVFAEDVALTPLKEQQLQSIDPLAEDELDAFLKEIPVPPPLPQNANDGTAGIGMDEAMPVAPSLLEPSEQPSDLQIGNTEKVRKNAANYDPDANDLTPPSQRTVLLGDPAIVGQPVGAVRIGTGVTTAAVPSEAWSQDLLEATHELYSEFARQFTPEARILIAPQNIKNRQAVGATQKLASGEYVIVPAQGRKLNTVDGLNQYTFNPSTKAKILDNAAHEFGHVLMLEHFMTGVDAGVQSRFVQEQMQGAISNETMAAFPLESQRLLQEYNDFRRNMKTQTALWFQSEWMSPAISVQRQLIDELGLAASSNAESFVKRLVGRGNPQVERLNDKIRRAKTVNDKQALVKEKDALVDKLMSEYLSFDEFMAEKFARYVHEKNLVKSPKALELLGGGRQYVKNEEDIRTTLLSKTFLEVEKALRSLFQMLKKGLKLASGQTYRIKAGVSFEAWLNSLSRSGQLMNPTIIPAELIGSKSKPEVKKTSNRYPKTPEAIALRKEITDGAFTTKEKAELLRMVRQGATVTVQERMVEILRGKVFKQLDTEVERKNPFKDSKVKQVVYHGTTSDFTTFSPEFIGEATGTNDWGEGFYFTDNPEAASQYAEGEGGNVRPVWLDIKNPATKKLMLSSKMQQIIDDGMGFSDVKTELAKMGYDGIAIEHKRGMEYVVFNPDQIRSVFDPVQQSIQFAGLNEKQAQNPKVQEIALREWKAKGEKSMFFKSFFGDWELGEGSKVVAADGKPLVLFHATQGDFDQFKFGDLGFHFGNLRAAHARAYKVSPTNARNEGAMQQAIDERIGMQEYRGKRNAQGALELTEKELGWNIIPVYLNIRNPLELDENGATSIWDDPVDMAQQVFQKGIIDVMELAEIGQQKINFMKQFSITQSQLNSMMGNRIRYQMFQPLRALLESKGFDGIKYENYVEGGTSWVAFKSSQVKTMNATFSSSSKIHYQTDVDLSTTTGLELDNLARLVEKAEGMGVTARALRQLARVQWYVLQQQQLAWIHPEFVHLDMSNAAAMQYNATKSRLQAQGEGVAQEWKLLGKEADAKLGRALEAEAAEGAHWTELQRTPEGLQHVFTAKSAEKLKEFGIDIESTSGKKAAEIYIKSKNVLLQQLLAAQMTLARRLGQVVTDEREFAIRLNELKKDFRAIMEKPFLPRGDYGSWGLVISEVKDGKRVIVHREMFESKKDLIKAYDLAVKNVEPGQKVKMLEEPLHEENKTLLALPLEYVTNAGEALGLTSEQMDLMQELLQPIKQEKLLKPYIRALEKISGGSKDRMRNFADFVWHNSTMIARTEAMPALNAAYASGKSMLREVENDMTISGKAKVRLIQDINASLTFMEKTKGYMLSPPNEWYGARSAVALIYLWGSIKTAALNLVGITSTISALTSQYGDIAGSAALIKAHKQGAGILTGAEVDPLVEELFNKALSEGTIIQSYAAHLAGAATAGTTKRLVNRSRWTAEIGTGVARLADAGMIPFTLAEQYTRRITFLSVVNAMVDEAKKKGTGINKEAIYAEAVKQTDLLQNSYTLANRPRIMRGGGTGGALVPLATIFLSFMGHFTFNAAGGYSLGAERRAQMNLATMPKSYISHTKRMLLMLLLLGGYEALPGAENMLDILDALFVKLDGKPLRQSLRESLQELPSAPGFEWFNDPRWWGKGLGGDMFGFDVSGSLGIGRIIPGTDVLAGSPTTAAEVMGRVAPALFGVAGGLATWATQTALDLMNGNDLTRNLTKFPGAVGGVASAMDWSERGVRGAKGELIHEPTQAEVIGKALNFNPTAVSEKREINWAKSQALDYWTTQRGLLQKHYNAAMDAQDREAIADTLREVDKFNDRVIDPKMRIRPYNLNSEYRQHRREAMKLEMGIAPKRAQQLLGDVEESFAEGEDL